MIRMLVSALLSVLANAAGLLIAATFVDGFSLNITGFIVAALIFTAIEVIAGPLIVKVSIKNMPAIRGGVALVTTLVALMFTTLFVDGMDIDGLGAWLMTTLVVWLVGVLAGVILPMYLFKSILHPEEEKKETSEE